MKAYFIFTSILLCIPFVGFTQVSEDSALCKEIFKMDTAFFKAYNECDLVTQAKYISKDLEFYHDKGGFSNDKQELLESLKNNICGKVTRTLVPGSFEVHEIPNYGAVALGYHTFYNKGDPDAPQKPGRFVNLVTKKDGVWQMTKVISLH